MEYALQTNNLTKTYNKKAACDHVSMSVIRGEIYGFIGLNGAGKTTMIRMIAGLASADFGSISLFGQSNPSELLNMRKRIGYIIESPSLYGSMSAYENLEVYRRLIGIIDKSSINKTLEMVGLPNTGNKKVKNFSLGMKQRLALAISILGNPDFLILDEPINGLDPSGIIEVRELLHRLNKEHGVTILVSSHILSELEKIATCYGIINNGALIDEFTSKELYSRCRQCLSIKVDNPQKTAYILETILNTKDFDILADNKIKLYSHLDQSGFVNSTLSQNDIIIESISIDGADLEDYFMKLMGGKQNETTA